MGMAASQARLLSITSRLADNELRAQIANNAKMRLAADSSRISSEYVNALNNATMMITNYDELGNSQFNKLNFNRLTQYSSFNTQYGLANTYGQLLVSENEAKIFEAAGGELKKYLEAHGLEWGTSYFDKYEDGNTIFGGKDEVELRDEHNNAFATFSLDTLKKMYFGNDTSTIEDSEGNSFTCNHAGFDKNNETYQTYVSKVNYMGRLYSAAYDNENVMGYVNDVVNAAIAKFDKYNIGTSNNDIWNLSEFAKGNFVGLADNGKGCLKDVLQEIYFLSSEKYGTAENPYYIPGMTTALWDSIKEQYLTENPSSLDLATIINPATGNAQYVSAFNGENMALQDSENNPVTVLLIAQEDSESVNSPLFNGDVFTETITDSGKDKTDLSGYTFYEHRMSLITPEELGYTKFSEDTGTYRNTNTTYNVSLVNSTNPEQKVSIYLNSKYTKLEDGNIPITPGVLSAGSRKLEDSGKVMAYLSSSAITNAWTIACEGIHYDSDSNTYSRNMDIQKDQVILSKDANGDYYLTIPMWNKPWYLKGENNIGFADINTSTNEAIRWQNGVDNSNNPKYDNNAVRQIINNKGDYGFVFKLTDGSQFSTLGFSVADENNVQYDTVFSFDSDTKILTIDDGSMGMVYRYQVDEATGNMYEVKTANDIYKDLTQQLCKEVFGTVELEADDNNKMQEIVTPGSLGHYINLFAEAPIYKKDADGNPVIDKTLSYLQAAADIKKDKDAQALLNLKDDINDRFGIDFSELNSTDYSYIACYTDELLKVAADTSQSDKTRANAQAIYDNYILNCLFDIYGEPNMGWTDSENPNGDADVKVQWYTNMFERMQKGYAVLEDGLASSNEWIEFALESGLVSIEQVDKQNNWNGTLYSNVATITEVTDDAAVARAEAEYKRAMNEIETKDKRIDIELKNIDTEHNSLQTEYNSVQSVISKNIERSFKMYS